MASRTVHNSGYFPGLDLSVAEGLEEVGEEMVREARSRAGWSSGVRAKIYSRLEHDARGPIVKFSTGGGLQNIAEDPRGPRRSSSGANRGTMKQFEVMKPAHDAVVAWRGLNVH